MQFKSFSNICKDLTRCERIFSKDFRGFSKIVKDSEKFEKDAQTFQRIQRKV